MHYVPESSRALLEGEAESSGRVPGADPGFHVASAPVYALTAVVGLLLLVDVLAGATGDPRLIAWQKPFGLQLALLAAVLGGSRILYHSLEGLLAGKIGADLALTIACLAAILLGEHSVAALVVLIALCGESIEGYTVDRATNAIRRIFELCPRQAHVIRDGREIDVAVEAVSAGDEVVVRPGERVPVDGQVLSGTTSVDQSALTGESLPIDKTCSDRVFAGTLNQFGAIVVTAEKIGDATTFGQVVQLVATAARRKAPLERTADRLARYFLPVVLLLAAATLVGWRLKSGTWSAGWMPALGVLVVACPCPLVLATPCAIVAAMAWLARQGVVIKGSIALERLSSIEHIAFDKTGTLTHGRLQVGDCLPSSAIDETELLRLAAAAEQPSEHLLARAIVAAADARNVVIPQALAFTAQPGMGVSAHVRAAALPPMLRSEGTIDDDERFTLVVGNRRLVESFDVQVTTEWEDRLSRLDQTGQTPLFVVLLAGESRPQTPVAVSPTPRILGLIGVRDTPRPEGPTVVRELKALGVRSITLLTGDRRSAASALASEIAEINDVQADLLPADKARWVEREVSAGHRVAMIGDGVNDAPALAAATVGLALGGVGSDLAAEAGDVILMGDPLAPLPGLLRLSRQMVRTIQQGIYVFAFGMNGLGVVLCAWNLLGPVGGALFHEAASLAVMLNSLRLLWFERWEQTAPGRFGAGFLNGAERVAESLSPTRMVQCLLTNRRMLARLAAALAGVVYLSWNCVVLTEDEQALVTRFGRHEATIGAGLQWRWPPPLERVHREKVGQIRSLQLGFRTERGAAPARGAFVRPIEWQAEHTERGYMPVPAESSLLAGDEVALELTAEAHYRIVDLRDYVEGTRNPAALIRAAAEGATRQVVAARALDEILAEFRADVEADCLRALRAAIAPCRLGVEVTGFTLLDMHPPTAVVPAYRDVANALEEREQAVNVAEAQYARRVLSTGGEAAIRALSDLDRPDVDATRRATTSGGVADWKLTDEFWAKLTDERDHPMLLSGTAAARLLNARREANRATNAARGQERRFSRVASVERAEPALTRFQLYWETIDRAFGDRPLTILDPHVGKTHLYLADPERFNLNPLNMVPTTPLQPVLETPPNNEPLSVRPGSER